MKIEYNKQNIELINFIKGTKLEYEERLYHEKRGSDSRHYGIIGVKLSGTYHDGRSIHVGDFVRLQGENAYCAICKDEQNGGFVMGLASLGLPHLGVITERWKIVEYVKFNDPNIFKINKEKHIKRELEIIGNKSIELFKKTNYKEKRYGKI